MKPFQLKILGQKIFEFIWLLNILFLSLCNELKYIKMKKIKYKQLYLQENKKVENLFKLYKKDSYTSRVIYFNDNQDYEIHRIGVFEKKNDDFNIILFEKKYGISITNRIY